MFLKTPVLTRDSNGKWIMPDNYDPDDDDDWDKDDPDDDWDDWGDDDWDEDED